MKQKSAMEKWLAAKRKYITVIVLIVATFVISLLLYVTGIQTGIVILGILWVTGIVILVFSLLVIWYLLMRVKPK